MEGWQDGWGIWACSLRRFQLFGRSVNSEAGVEWSGAVPAEDAGHSGRAKEQEFPDRGAHSALNSGIF